jgi:uncharacterized protein with ACT and thioredoxin-like domain
MRAKPINIGDRIDISQVYAVWTEGVVEDIITKKNGNVYYKVRGIKQDGTLGAIQHEIWDGKIPGFDLSAWLQK